MRAEYARPVMLTMRIRSAARAYYYGALFDISALENPQTLDDIRAHSCANESTK